ncbi:hypothetical protein PACTADRAFT_51038 [Pachysolen tannophilus NRRL Y-2460]|uniref:DNA repair protein REV1 n=1 Tax=Pachysolen tannophilus NRRL Y-2460 TaxID=669874 RepID=A0A1E4TQZ9_PACTA|nr:hypothetical protein PACTADRAFT_51038 [Pachysolen tannophilus NRRL Y-2460]
MNFDNNSSSFITSLGDDELIEFINKLSQEKKSKRGFKSQDDNLQERDHDHLEVETDVDTELDDHEELDVNKIFPPSSPLKAPSSVPIHQDKNNNISVVGEKEEEEEEEAGLKPQDGIELEFGDYATYFKEKQKKQQEADYNYKEWDANRRRKQYKEQIDYPQIFVNCIIHVTGRTEPDITQLHKLIVLHGGKFLHYLGAKGNATHIIAGKLTPRKKLEFAKYKVLKPEWITESVSCGKLLPWMDYTLIDNDYGQTKLNFNRKAQTLEKSDNAGEKTSNDDDDDDDEFGLAAASPEETDLTQDPMVIENNDNQQQIDAKNPDFLQIFFAKSRLHHLSTWKSDLREEFFQKALAKLRERKSNIVSSAFKKSSSSKIIFHIDFDCFFATVSALNQPNIDPSKQPICVTHGGGNADIASCNYVARKSGVKNGMWFNSAKKLCPNLIPLGYKFDEYDRISKIFYKNLLDLELDSVLPVSVDEALLDVTSLCTGGDDDDETIIEQSERAMQLAKKIKKTIFEETDCSVSIGIGRNVLLAKLALRRAKPDGIFQVSDPIHDFLENIPVKDLPGVGYNIAQKLAKEFGENSDFSIGSLKQIEKQKLINMFGIKTGTRLYDYARGIDKTNIDISSNPQDFQRKSVSIDINWGIRFDNIQQVDMFLVSCAKEMNTRLAKINKSGSQIMLKLARRAPNAPIEPTKYLGMGDCVFCSKSARFGIATREIGLISTESKSLFRILNVPPTELRGVSIQITNLVDDSATSSQMKLQFKKAEKTPFTTTRKEKDQVTDNVSSPEIQKISSTSSQYDVPNDVHSSLLKELPADIRQKVENQRQKTKPKISNNNSSLNFNNNNNHINSHEIDWEVFKELPLDIQNELKIELKRREIPILGKPDTPTKRDYRTSPSKFHLQQIFPESPGEKAKVVRVLSPSPRKKRKIIAADSAASGSIGNNTTKIKPPPLNFEELNVDKGFLDELPASVRNEIIADFQYQQELKFKRQKFQETEEEFRKIQKKLQQPRSIRITSELYTQLLGTRTKPPPRFQFTSSFTKIKELIITWIRSTINVGPHEDDFNKLMEFIVELISTKNFTKSINILKIILVNVQIEKKNCDNYKGFQEWESRAQMLKEFITTEFEKHNIIYEL